MRTLEYIHWGSVKLKFSHKGFFARFALANSWDTSKGE